MMSTLHRATGIVLSVGLLCFVFWLKSPVQGPDAYASAAQLVTAPLGLVVLGGWFVVFFTFVGSALTRSH